MTTYDIRPPRAADLRHLAAIEEAGVPMFEELWGPLGPPLASPAPSGGHRDDQPGFLLVAGSPPVGFVHVLVIDAFAHLEQVAVHPSAGRRGLGSALVRAAMEGARLEGFAELSLCTYRDVPWNGPFYRRLGFREVDRPWPFQRDLRRHEREVGLDEFGPRVVMSAPLSRQVTGE